MPTIDRDSLENYARRIFVAAGAPEENAGVVAEHLVQANLMGHDSHGVIRIPWYLQAIQSGGLDPNGVPVIEQETESTAIVNGNWNFGQVVGRYAMNVAIEKARTNRVACVTTHDSHHVGRVGAYPSMAAAAGMLAIASVNNGGSGQLLAPYGGVERRMSPNPIAISFPTGGTPFLLDMTTSTVAGGKLDVYRNRGDALPEGWAVKADGTPMRDARDFRSGEGAILPLGGVVGWKGYGLAFALDVLCGALSPAGCSRADIERFCNALWILVIDPTAFTPLDEFRSRVEGLVEYCKSSAKMPGFDEILVAGEPEARSAERRGAEGIPLDDATWAQINTAAAGVGVQTPAVAAQAAV